MVGWIKLQLRVRLGIRFWHGILLFLAWSLRHKQLTAILSHIIVILSRLFLVHCIQRWWFLRHWHRLQSKLQIFKCNIASGIDIKLVEQGIKHLTRDLHFEPSIKLQHSTTLAELLRIDAPISVFVPPHQHVKELILVLQEVPSQENMLRAVSGHFEGGTA